MAGGPAGLKGNTARTNDEWRETAMNLVRSLELEPETADFMPPARTRAGELRLAVLAGWPMNVTETAGGLADQSVSSGALSALLMREMLTRFGAQHRLPVMFVGPCVHARGHRALDDGQVGAWIRLAIEAFALTAIQPCCCGATCLRARSPPWNRIWR